ncbi:MAG TPA: DNA repair protein RecN [Bacteroidia bacterium]|jgi:DNA repair protein RecN (Recombination protein N)|nr:DNA repair protein RecN [Bacteroidia bacterium]
MLKSLHIKNYALIDQLEIDLGNGFTIITGETGAGKSILLGALGLLLGDRADSSALSDKTKKCVVEGSFELKEYHLKDFFNENDIDYEHRSLIRREVSVDGKSRAFINDTPVNISILKEIGNKLVDIHSQHETLMLNESKFQMNILDAVASNGELLEKYSEAFRAYRKTSQLLAELTANEAKTKKDLDYFRFQFDELNELKLKKTEQEELEAELETLENAETIKDGLDKSSRALDGGDENLLTALAVVRSTLQQISRFNMDIEALKERINSAHIELKDIAAEIDSLNESIVHDPKRIDIIQERLDNIYRLQQKHNVKTVEELLTVKEELETKIDAIGSLEDQIKKVSKELDTLKAKLNDIGGKLSKKRNAAAPDLTKSVKKMLADLGMPNAELKVEIEKLEEANDKGFDKVNFLFSANKGSAAQPLNKVASGGELSRLMLSLKALLAKHTALPTIIFDEIDAGISGDIAGKTGEILKQMSENMQVISITHLPQVASKGKDHLFVYKEEKGKQTYTRIKQLGKEERVQEIAKMLSSGKPGEAAVRNAKELLSIK